MSVYNTGEDSISIGKVSDLDKERFFRMALNEETEVNSLLAYYRDRINEFDHQREDWLNKYNKIRTPQDEAHKQAWELQKRREEVAELQHTLEEGKLSLYNERQEIMDLIKENDQLKLKELEDRKKISELMLLGEPLEQEVVFYKDVKPETINKYMKNDLSLHTNKDYEAALQKTRGKDIPQKLALTSKTGRGIIKTIYLPNDQLNTVALENEELKAKLEEDREICLSQAEQLREELRDTENELYRIYENNQEEIKEYIKKNQSIEKENINLVKDYYELILESNAVERKINEENELLRLKNAALANKLKIQVKKAMTDTQSAMKLVDMKSDEYNNKYRQEIRQKEEELNLIKDQYAQIQKIYLQRMKELEGHLTKLAKKHSTLERRRLLENEGFKTDTKRMRSRLVEYQRHLERVGMSYPHKKIQRNEENDDDEVEEGDAEAARAARQELDLIKKQLNDLEVNLDKARKLKS